MKIIADENIPFVHEFFDCFGEVCTVPGRTVSAEQVQNADILLVRSVTQVNAALLEGSRVRFVGTCTIGTDHLDTEYLLQQGIAYASAPGCNAGGVLQYDVTALSYLDERWWEKTIGVIGHGNVGGRIARALNDLGLNVRAYDPFLNESQVPYLVGLTDVLACDVVCVHTPYTRQGTYPTHHLIGRPELEMLQDDAILLNAGRGGAIDNQALKAHLQSGSELTVVLDVWENEPEVDVELLPFVRLATPHIAGYSFEGKLNGSSMVFAALARFLQVDERWADQHISALLERLQGPLIPIEVSTLHEAIRHTYEIDSDDLRTRMAISEAAKGEVGTVFDRLRKHYPERREFAHFKVQTSDSALLKATQRLGFAV